MLNPQETRRDSGKPTLHFFSKKSKSRIRESVKTHAPWSTMTSCVSHSEKSEGGSCVRLEDWETGAVTAPYKKVYKNTEIGKTIKDHVFFF